MAGLIIINDDGTEELGLHYRGGGLLIADSPTVYVSAGFLLNPPDPWEVHNLRGQKPDELGLEHVTIRLPASRLRPERLWKLTLRPDHDGGLGYFEAQWPD